ncbi:MAG: NAD(P)H-binding protein [Acidimicrobiia bacterium]
MTSSGAHVVFGAGPVGSALIDELVERDLWVRAVSRSGARNLPPGVEVVAGDASDPEFSSEAARDAVAVYQVMNPPYDRWPQLFPPLQDAVIAAAQANNARFVSFENLYAYGDTMGTPISEELPLEPDTKKGRVRARMAEQLSELNEKGDLIVSTVRSSDYLGPGATWQSPIGERVIGRAIQGKSAQVIGDPSKLHSYTFVKDAGRVLATCGTEERAFGDVFIVPNAPAVSTRLVIEMVGDELGRDIAISVAPAPLLRVMGIFNANLREVLEMKYEFDRDFVADGSKFTRTFGIGPTPLRQSVGATVAWWRSANS